jgi:alkylhydroperoxidase family enzyme
MHRRASRRAIAFSTLPSSNFDGLARLFSAKEIVDLTMIAAQYMGTAMLTNALRTKIDEPGVLSVIVLGPC